MKMFNFSRKRQAAGNICLVLFTAFLFTMLVPMVSLGNAEAAETNLGTVTYQGATSDNPVDFTKDGDNYALGLELLFETVNPLTSENFSSVIVNFFRQDNSLFGTVYFNDLVVEEVYEQVYEGVYQTLYSLVYSVPGAFDFNYHEIITAMVYGASDTPLTVYLRSIWQPPNPGSGSSPSTTTPVVTDTDGNVTVTPTPQVSGNAATVSLNPGIVTNILNNLLPSTQEVVIEVPKQAGTVNEIKVELPVNFFDALAEKAKDLTIKTSDVSFILPPAALNIKELTKDDPNAKVTVSVKEIPAATVDLSGKIAGDKALSPVGKVFDFTVTVQTSSGSSDISSFSKKITVAIPYDPAELMGANESFLGAYRITATGYEYVGGKVDKASKTVVFETGSFSYYTLMAYSKTFRDISAHWAKEDIELMAAKNIAKGITADQFAPGATVTRAQFAALLQRALGLAEVKPAKAAFKDVKTNAWYYGAVEAAVAAGLVKGYEDGTFKPEGLITRQEMAIMVTNALKAGGKAITLTQAEADAALAGFADGAAIGSWAKEGAAIAVKEGIIKGRTASEYAPVAKANRAEGIVMIKRVLTSLNKL